MGFGAVICALASACGSNESVASTNAGGADASAEADAGASCVGSWSAITTEDARIPRSRHVAALVGGEVVLWGGTRLNPTYPNVPEELSNGARFDPTTGAVVYTDATPPPRQRMLASAHGSELLVFGGIRTLGPDSSGQNILTEQFQDGFLSNPKTGALTSIPEGPHLPSLQHVALMGDVLAYLSFESGSLCRFTLGGATWNCESFPEYFDTGPPGGSLQDAGFAFAVGEIFQWGGSSGSSTEPSSAGFRLSLETSTWSAMSNVDAPEPGILPVMKWLGSKLFVGGGSAALYDPSSDVWTPLPPLPNAQILDFDYDIVALGERVLIWNHALREGVLYDPAVSGWTPLCGAGSMSAGNSDATATGTGSELVVLGGQKSGQQLGARLALP